jgi:hypothetical protein
MPLAIVAEPAPLETDTDGVVRVGKTRVTLDTVVSVFKQGTTAEEIVRVQDVGLSGMDDPTILAWAASTPLKPCQIVL